ncbi:MAG: NAD(P)-dependent oxidoreductase [Anaerolineaceae bacterium]|nr:NAD(P)-dependent oxidoreductase [Anaerolineaceae bacterium]
MQILLTGGSGSVGHEVVNRLVKKGHSMRVIGRRADMAIEGAQYQQCDVDDYPRLREVIRGCEAVVHLAALPNPSKGTPEEIFRVNCQGTFNVFQAAAEEGIRRVVQASSINAAGQFYGVKPAPLHYLPLDEAHPVFSTDAYSFSKNIIEEIGKYFWRREGISSVAYRLPWVAPISAHDMITQRRERIHSVVDGLLGKSKEEHHAWFEHAWKSYNDFRASKPYEKDNNTSQLLNNLPEAERNLLFSISFRVNFFTMLDERDSALAVEKGLEASFEGSHALFINDSRNWTGVESRVLADLFYPDVNEFKKEITGYDTLVSIDRARQLIGFEPEYSYGTD